MARFLLLSLGACSLTLAAVAQPSPPPNAPPKPGDAPGNRPGNPPCKRGWDGEDSPGERFKRRLEKLSPEERERFQKNWDRWKAMGEKERDELRQRAEVERERVRRTIDDAIARAGLTLDKDQREVFAVRYRQERRKIEEDLRREFERVRSARIDQVLEKLKAEFTPARPAAEASPSPSASPAPSP